MWIPDDQKKFTSKFRYVEYAKWAYSAKQDRWSVFREMDYSTGEPKMFSIGEVQAKARADEVGCYASIFHYNSREIGTSQAISSLYFDLDSEDAEESKRECSLLVSHLLGKGVPEAAIRVYFTGKKGFHVEVESVTLGVGPSADLANIFRYIAKDIGKQLDLTTLDFQVYDKRRMWRIPNTKHQGTNLYKIPISTDEVQTLSMDDIVSLAETTRDIPVPAQAFSFQANEWYRSYVYQQEEDSIPPADRIDRFMRLGTGIATDAGTLEFDPTCFERCNGLERLWDKAERTHDLTHEERLFLCSVLTYSDKAIEYLHAILSECDDYSPDKSRAHIEDWIRRREQGIGGNPFSCERAKMAGVMCDGCDKLEPIEKMVNINGKLVPTGEMAKPSPVRVIYERKRSYE